jgi:hypothetical protein
MTGHNPPGPPTAKPGREDTAAGHYRIRPRVVIAGAAGDLGGRIVAVKSESRPFGRRCVGMYQVRSGIRGRAAAGTDASSAARSGHVSAGRAGPASRVRLASGRGAVRPRY